MRTLKDAMSDQEDYEGKILALDAEEEIVPSIVEYDHNDASPMDKAYKDLSELDQVVYEHTNETDEVIKTAKDSFDTIFTLAQSVPPDRSARLFEVAAQYLDIINKSSDSKVSAKHDRAKLSVALTKAQIQAGLVESAVNQGIKAHRNDILKAIMGGDVQEAEFSDDKPNENLDGEENKYSKDPEEKK